MRYWWVNHKQTSKFEIAGGFLWSPMRNKNGARNKFYDNMRIAAPGDAVISFSHAKISFFGVVTDFATPAPKPILFGEAGDNWNKKEGWALPVTWHKLMVPITPKHRIHEFSHFLPNTHSPIHPLTGKGAQNAYLAEIDENIFDLLIGGINLDNACSSPMRPSSVIRHIDDSIEESIRKDKDMESTVKESLIDARVGQGVFKERIFEFERSCRLTKVRTPSLLIGSHIKPWRLCVTASERLDGANGLLLAPHVDLLFDRGFISFSDEGDVLVSSHLDFCDLELLGLTESCKHRGNRFHDRQAIYLAFHRDNVFLP